MNKKLREEFFKKMNKRGEQDALIKKVAEDVDLNAAEDADAYSDKVFNALLNDIKIDGLED